MVYTQGKLEVHRINRDNETGVLYMQNQSGFGSGLTVMLDKDGRALIDESYISG